MTEFLLVEDDYFPGKVCAGGELIMILGTFKKDRPEPGRNDSCPCGSGKKFKKCCLDTGYAGLRKKVIVASIKNKEAGI